MSLPVAQREALANTGVGLGERRYRYERQEQLSHVALVAMRGDLFLGRRAGDLS